ncbi:MAG: cobalamin adenosyltransferase [Clostridium sp.]|nr:cobalamin adenosyltransferase [Clostridium sp.]
MMKFITEEYLRDVFRKEPFDTFELEEGQRLTPGAKQYLSDKGIRMQDDVFQIKKDRKVPEVKQEVKQSLELPKKGTLNKNLKKKLCCKLKTMEAVFLVTSSEILNEDIILAQSIISLGRKISNIRNAVEGKSILETIPCKPCTGITFDNFCNDIDDCFEVTEFHMQLEKSKEILKMHSLRCALREIEPVVIEAYEGNDDEFANKIIGNVNSIINTLSQMICSTVGGIKCQRKN